MTAGGGSHPSRLVADLEAAVGADHVRTDAASRAAYGVDALKQGHAADVVVVPADTAEVAAVVRVCRAHRTPMVPRGAGTGYTGGAVPVRGGVVIALERLNRIVAIDVDNLVAVAQCHVVTGDLARAVEQLGLYYPPDPASLSTSTIGGNIAECAGGPRAFKYGVTRRYVLGLEAVLPTGEVIRTGGKSVKNVVGYDLTQLLTGSEGTLAIITEATLRLIALPPARVTLRATFADIAGAARAVNELVHARVTPAALELLDGTSLAAAARYLGTDTLAPPGTQAMLLLEVDGLPHVLDEEVRLVRAACAEAGALEVLVAQDDASREALWQVRRDLSLALRAMAPLKVNHDVVVPKGRIPDLYALVQRLAVSYDLRIPSFGHAGDGNIHVNILVDPADASMMARARRAEGDLFAGVVALEGSISGEHGIGFSKLPFIGLELTPDVIALMRRVKSAFDPEGLLNPGKVLPDV